MGVQLHRPSFFAQQPTRLTCGDREAPPSGKPGTHWHTFVLNLVESPGASHQGTSPFSLDSESQEHPGNAGRLLAAGFQPEALQTFCILKGSPGGPGRSLACGPDSWGGV